MADAVPQKMGDYEILGVLGAGGMGRVYRVRNVITDRVEAMKVLLPDLQGHEQVAARFQREIKLLAALRHPNIASLLTALTIDNQLVMIMEYVEGRPLSSRLSEGAIPVPDALNYIDQVLGALAYAHQQHIVHRDIKPANMMLTPDGTVKLMDFGIARTGDDGGPNKLTATGSTLGSISYMSPEQIKGVAVDERSDLYSLGISLYEMITGQRPFQGDSDFSIMAAHINDAPRAPIELHPDLPPGLNEIILTAIHKAPEQRFQTASAFRNAVRAVRRQLQDGRTVVMGSDDTPFVAPPVAAPAATQAMGAATAPQRTVAGTMPAAPAPAQPAPVAGATAPRPSSHRGLYITLGAVIVLAVLVAAGLVLPRVLKSPSAAERANQPPAAATTAPATTQPKQVVTEPAPQTSGPAASAAPIEQPKTEPAPSSGLKKSFKGSGATTQQGSAPTSGAAAVPQGPSAAELDQLEREIDQLSGRAGGINSSLDRLQQEQASMGLGLRGDMASRQSSMNLNVNKAQDAIGRNDYERAKRYAQAAERDIEALEKFLGR